ncbi:PP2C family protein-serine/threonine phosphatase [Bacillus massiliglaciei]|uniref:PP2C family protein-serine/threonine phosphatase n=1 Tax=Bacillus massiliglaciei TaxID=1816693 RepID=UPI000ABB0B6B|nr:PP2C family protein-serine/threonine phosphatase [Bacillus massiliglaciei]
MFRRELDHSHQDLASASKTLEREINLAKNIQQTLLNGEKPSLENDEITGISIPARLIGGDYFDFYSLPNGKLRVIIGDVMGKGIPAAMLMILTRGAFRTAAESTQGPGETLTSMNNALYKDLRKLKSFVTVFCADWDSKTGLFTYANAGHSLPEIIRSDAEKVQVPKVKGVMLGGLPNQVYHQESITLIDGDLIVLYTDGIIEAQNTEGEMYKSERLLNVLKESITRSASEIETAVVASVENFTETMPQRDDITLVTLKVGSDRTEISGFNSPLV